MTTKQGKPEQSEHRGWYKGLLDETVQHLLKSGVLKGVAIEAVPVWMLPGQILISRIWPVAEKSKFIWAISGDAVITDHVVGTVAVNPRDVARHFSLKWQMDAEQVLQKADQPSLTEPVRQSMRAYANQMISGAELLYELSERKEGWTPSDRG